MSTRTDVDRYIDQLQDRRGQRNDLGAAGFEIFKTLVRAGTSFVKRQMAKRKPTNWQKVKMFLSSIAARMMPKKKSRAAQLVDAAMIRLKSIFKK